MHISFLTQKLRKTCENNEFATKELGQRAAKALRSRLADLSAAQNISDVIAGFPKMINIRGRDCYIIQLDDDYILIISSNHIKHHRTIKKTIDWNSVTRVIIRKIEMKK